MTDVFHLLFVFLCGYVPQDVELLFFLFVTAPVLSVKESRKMATSFSFSLQWSTVSWRRDTCWCFGGGAAWQLQWIVILMPVKNHFPQHASAVVEIVISILFQ